MMTSKHIVSRRTAGFTLTEMLVTTLIMVLASTLLATGIPVAIDTYQKTVNSANAQVAMTTTLTVLRTEYGLTTETKTIDSVGADGVVNHEVYYRTEEGIWATIRSPKSDEDYRGLVKEYVDSDETDGPDPTVSLGVYPLVPNATLMGANKQLFLSVDKIELAGDIVTATNVAVRDAADPADANNLASLDSYNISTRFAKEKAGD